MSITAELINTLINDKKVYAIVIDVGSGTATVRLVGSSAKLSNLLVSGETVAVGDRVTVLWDGAKPYILSGNATPTTSAAAPAASPLGGLEEDPAQTIAGYGPGDIVLDAYDDLVADGKIAAGSTIWTDYNDGTGSGLDADTLDGLHGSAYLLAAGDIIEGELSTEEQSPGSVERLFIDPSDATYRMWAGALAGADAPFGIYKTGGIKAVAGDIGGWDITASTINKNNVTLDSTGKITVGTGNNIAVIDSTDGTYVFWIGHATSSSAPFRVTPAGVVYLNSAIVSGYVQTSNYQSGLKGFKMDSTGRAEFNEISARGEIVGVIFKKEVINMFSGRNRVAFGDILTEDCLIGHTTITVAGNELASSDFIQIKTSASVNEWMQITDDGTPVASGYEYNVQRDLDGSGENNHYIGAPMAALGNATTPDEDPKRWGEFVWGYYQPWGGDIYQATGGFLTIDGSRDYGPYFGVARRFGASYNQIEDVARFGRLYGFLGETSEVYGIALGDTTRYLKYDYTNGLRIVTNDGAVSIDDGGIVAEDFGLTAVSDAPSYVDGRLIIYIDSDDHKLYGVYKDGVDERTVEIAAFDGGAGPGGIDNVVEDLTPQLGGDLDLNGFNIDFPSTPNISDVKDEDNMASNSATMLATQQSIKAYVDANTPLIYDTSPQLGGDLDLNGFNIDFPSTPNISDVLDEDDMSTDSATALATQQSIKAYVDARNLAQIAAGGTYRTFKQFAQATKSSGLISGCVVSDNGDGSIDITAGEGYLRETDSAIAEIKTFAVSSTSGMTPTQDALNYIYVSYNAGSPTTAYTTDITTIDHNTEIVIALVYQESDHAHIAAAGQKLPQFEHNVFHYLWEVNGKERASGFVTSEDASEDRALNITAGVMYWALERITTSAIDTSTDGANDEMTLFYDNGAGGWTLVTAQHVLPNTQYDNGSGTLQDLTANRYGTYWVYVSVDGYCYVQYGQGDYTLAQAEAASVPDTMDEITGAFILVAKIIFQKSAANFYSITVPWSGYIGSSAPTDHGSLAGTGDDDHPHYLLADGTREYTSQVITDNAIVTIDSADVADNDFAKFTANGLEGRSYAEVRADLDLEIGTDVLAQQTIGIADDNLLEVDGTLEADDVAVATANGLKGLTPIELLDSDNLTGIDANDILQSTASGLVGLTYAELVALLDGAADWDYGDSDLHNMKQVDFQDEHDHGNSSADTDIDWREGNNQKITLNDSPTLTFTAPDGACHLQLKVVQDGTGSRTITWPTMKWSAGVAPTLSTGAADEDIISIWYDGSSYYGAFLGNFATP